MCVISKEPPGRTINPSGPTALGLTDATSNAGSFSCAFIGAGRVSDATANPAINNLRIPAPSPFRLWT